MKHLFTLLLFFIVSKGLIAQQSYYDDVDLSKTGLALKAELTQKITTSHTNFLSYTPDVWEASKITDENPQNANEVLLIYGWEDGSDEDVTNDRSRSKNKNGGNAGDWNREHVFPKSLGNPNLGTEGPGADAHHLRPSDVQYNGSRGNRRFADGSGNSGTVNTNWYPGDEFKGDVARMIMYMYLRYGERCLPSAVGIGTTNEIDEEMIDLFLEWNAEDPVSFLEDNRNAYHDSDAMYAQGNRNPFIDNPYLATQIWGGPEAENRWEESLSTTQVQNTTTIRIFPNPAKNHVYIHSQDSIDYILIFDTLGKQVGKFYSNELDLEYLKDGVYFMNVFINGKKQTHKLVMH